MGQGFGNIFCWVSRELAFKLLVGLLSLLSTRVLWSQFELALWLLMGGVSPLLYRPLHRVTHKMASPRASGPREMAQENNRSASHGPVTTLFWKWHAITSAWSWSLRSVWEETAQACGQQEVRIWGTNLMAGYYTMPVVLHTFGLQPRSASSRTL